MCISIRRSLEVANRFCTSHHIDSTTQAKISNYFKYMSSSEMNNCIEQTDLALLPEHLRCDFVLQKVWKSIKKIPFLDSQLYDKVSAVHAVVCWSHCLFHNQGLIG